jgi:uncharacterized membrane protein
MNLGTITPDPVLSSFSLWLVLPFLAVALIKAPWRQLMAEQERMTALGVAISVLAILWSMSPELQGGEKLHLLGMTTVTLVFGWQLALFAGVLAGLVLVVVGNWGLDTLPLNLLLAVVVPVGVSALVLALANQLRRTNLFVYMLGVGFMGSMLAIGATLWVASFLLGTELDHALVLLIMFPEGFINGTVITALTVFAPQLMRTYDDQRYLGKPR